MSQIHVRKRENGTWQYYFEAEKINGKRKRITKSGFKKQKLAQEAGAKAYYEYWNNKRSLSSETMTYADLLDEWLEKYCPVKFLDQTIYSYSKVSRNYIKPYIGNIPLQKLTTGDIEDVINIMVNKGYSINVINNYVTVVSSSLKYAKNKKNYIDKNPAKGVELPNVRVLEQKSLNSHPNDYIEKDSINKIFERFTENTPQHYLSLLFAYRCGLRSGEIYGLSWDDIDFETHQLKIQRQMQYSSLKHHWYLASPKYNSKRTIYLDDDTLEILKKFKKIHDEKRNSQDFFKYYIDKNNLFITKETGKEFDAVIRRNDTSLVTSGVRTYISDVIHHKLEIKNFTIHSLRHTHATDLKIAGFSDLYIANRLGHKSIKQTSEYTSHLTDEERAYSNEKLNALFS